MQTQYANEFREIPMVLAANTDLRDQVLALVSSEPMPGKVLEGGNRLDVFRSILERLIRGELSLQIAYAETEASIPRVNSIHSANKRVFPSGWAERLVRTQLSRFYNQAVLQAILKSGQRSCFVPHSTEEDSGSKCSLGLAGREHDAQVLLDRLTASYSDGNWSSEPKIPEHPHCTHTITPAP